LGGAIFVSKTVYQNSNFTLLHELAHVAGWYHPVVKSSWDLGETFSVMSKERYNNKNPFLYHWGTAEFGRLNQ